MAKAFLDIYLPLVLCVPAWPRLILAGLPDPTFQEAAILPIATVFLFHLSKLYRYSPFDLLILAFLVLQGLSEYLNAGYAEAQNLMFDMFCNGLLPYLLAKSILRTFNLRTQFLRRFVWCVCVVIVIALYEVKFSYNPYKIVFDALFPEQGDAWVTTFRYGFPRVAGPYGHAILAGIIFMIAIRLQSWLRQSNLWNARFRPVHFGNISKGKWLTIWTVLGLLLTWVRGPQFGAVLAWGAAYAARGKNPKKRMRIALAVFGFVSIPLALWGYAYASIGRASATTAGQESAAYRKELLSGYVSIVRQRLLIGWGQNGWPHLPSMPSIDNYYLLVSLMHGVISLGLLVIILLIVGYRLYLNGMRTLKSDRLSSSLSFELLGIYVGFAFSIGTVYIGESVMPVFFMMLGLSEALIMSGKRMEAAQAIATHKVRAELPPLRFRRVLT